MVAQKADPRDRSVNPCHRHANDNLFYSTESMIMRSAVRLAGASFESTSAISCDDGVSGFAWCIGCRTSVVS